MPVLSFSGRNREPSPNLSAYQHANENARFKHNRYLFNNKMNERIKARELAEKKSTQAKKKMEKAHDKGEGQVKVKF